MSAGLFLSVLVSLRFFFFKQKTAYEMRISDWSSDVCSSDLDPIDDTGLRSAVGAGLRIERAFAIVEEGGALALVARRGDDILAGHGVGRGTRHWLAAADQVDAQRSVAPPLIARVIVVAARYIPGLDHATLDRKIGV